MLPGAPATLILTTSTSSCPCHIHVYVLAKYQQVKTWDSVVSMPDYFGALTFESIMVVKADGALKPAEHVLVDHMSVDNRACMKGVVLHQAVVPHSDLNSSLELM